MTLLHSVNVHRLYSLSIIDSFTLPSLRAVTMKHKVLIFGNNYNIMRKADHTYITNSMTNYVHVFYSTGVWRMRT